MIIQSQGQGTTPPVLDIDPFAEAFLADPTAHYGEMQDAGPVFYIPKYDLYATAQYDIVKTVMGDWKTYCSSAGVGLSNFLTEEPWRAPSLILEADPPAHTRARTVLVKVLSADALKTMKTDFEAEAARCIGALAAREVFDGVTDLATPYPTKVFGDAVGLAPDGRENLLRYGAMVFNGFGPRNALFEAAMEGAEATLQWITARCQKEALAPGGLGAKIYEAVDRDELSKQEAALLVRSFLSAGVDTTANSLANMLYCFAAHPEQYRILREDPAKYIRRSFNEVLRYLGPVQVFFRTTTEQTELSGFTIPAKKKVLVCLAAANRDPAKWPDPDKFDITRNASGQVGFGTGVHGCVGQAVARLEAEVVLTELVKTFSEIELDGDPVWQPNNSLRGLKSLPLRTVAA